MQPFLLFKLDQNRDGRGLRCDRDGLFLGREPLLRKGKDGVFEARPPEKLLGIFNRTYGGDVDWESRIRSVRLIATALNEGGMARATMTAVLMARSVCQRISMGRRPLCTGEFVLQP